MGFNQTISAALGPVSEDPVVFAGNIGTTVEAVDMPDGYLTAFGGVIRAKITNLSTTARIAWRLSDRDDGYGDIGLSADITSALCGVIVAPGDTEYINFSANLKLFVIASAATTPICISTVLV